MNLLIHSSVCAFLKPSLKKIFFSSFVITLLTGASPPARAWNLNDLTYLFPLPELHQEDFAKITPDDNAVLPLEIYRFLPQTIFSLEDFSRRAHSFRLVSARIDPVKNQVRFIWQSVILKTELEKLLPEYARPGLKTLKSLAQATLPLSKTYSSEDYSLHSFYQLNSNEMKQLLEELHALKNLGEKQSPPIFTEKLALQIHPAFLQKAYKIEFALRLKASLLKFCNSNSLIQATASFSTVPEIWWDFAGIVKENGNWKPLAVPGLGTEIKQSFSSEALERDLSGIFPMGRRSIVVPFNHSQNNLETALNLLHPYSEADRPKLLEELKVVRRFQNPKLSNTENLDCVHCHVTESAQASMLQLAPDIQNGAELSQESYANPNPKRYDLRNNSVANRSTKILRALGYWNSYPVFNQRVINETAESAEFLNQSQ